MRKIIYVMKNEQTGILYQSKNLLILFFIVVVYEEILSVLFELSGVSGMDVGFLEPFILLCNNRINVIAIPLIYITIISNFPYCRMNYFGMIRLNKLQWLAGELLFSMSSALAVVMLIFLGTFLYSFGKTGFSMSWSTFMSDFSFEYNELFLLNKEFILGPEIKAHGGPLLVTMYSALSMWLYMVSLSMGIICGVVMGNKWVAVICDIVITLVSGAVLYTDGKLSWLFPLYHTIFGNHFYYMFARVKMPLWASIVFLCGITAVLFMVSALKLKKLNIGE